MNSSDIGSSLPPPTSRVGKIIESVDHLASDLELKWGPGRLRLLVDEQLRGKFDRQRSKFNDAVWSFDDRQIDKHAAAMRRAWQALDRAAEEAGAEPLDPDVFETTLDDGRVIAVARNSAEAWVAAHRLGRDVSVWSMSEIARLIDGYPELVDIKTHWPGAAVKAVRTPLPDKLDDEVPF